MGDVSTALARVAKVWRFDHQHDFAALERLL